MKSVVRKKLNNGTIVRLYPAGTIAGIQLYAREEKPLRSVRLREGEVESIGDGAKASKVSAFVI